MNKIIEFFKEKLQDIKDERRKTSIAKVIAFSKENKNCVIFMMDVRSDDMVAAYRDKYLAARVMNQPLPPIPFKRKTGLVKSILLGHGNTKKRSLNMIRFRNFIEEFLWQMSDKLGTPTENAERQKKDLRQERSAQENNQLKN